MTTSQADQRTAPAQALSSDIASEPGSRRKIVKAASLAAGILALGAAYVLQARTVAVTSESASQALQAWDMLHGNVLLRGWSLSDVSFCTTELPEYALVEIARGLNASVVPIAAAMSYFFQVLLAAWLAKGRATGREGWTRMLIAGGIMAAPPLGASTTLLMSSPDHAGTQVPVLLIFLALDRLRPRWWVPVLVTGMLAWAQIADPIVLLEAALPVLVVCVLRMDRRRGRLAENWFELSLALGTVLSVGIAHAVLKLIGHVGGFYVRSPIAVFATPAQLSSHFWPETERFLQVFGADFLGQNVGPQTLSAVIHLVGVALVVWAVVHVVGRLFVLDDLVVQILGTAFLLLVVAYVVGTKSEPNEIIGLLPTGAALAGRVLTGKVIANNLVPALSVVLAGTALLLLHNVTQPASVNPNQQVASWLEAHHLRYGLAGFWNASSVSLETGNRVEVRPVRTYHDEVVWTNVETNSAWYQATSHDARFVIWNTRQCGNICLTGVGLSGGFGPPASTYRVGSYFVLLYPQNLLTSVREVAFCGNVWGWHTKTAASRNLHC